MSRVRARGGTTATVTFCTDLNPHRLWVHPHTDAYLVTSQTSAAFVRRFDPEARIVVVPAPVRPQFYRAPDRSQARDALGIPADAGAALLMAGAWGLGPLAAVAAALADAGVHVIAVAGRNASLERRLQQAAANRPRIIPFGFTDRVPELMAAADVVVTTAGDTCSEARVLGRRLVLLDTVAGHGRENLQHELEVGAAAVAATEPDLLTRAVLRVVRDGDDPPPQDRRPAWEAGLDELLAAVLPTQPVSSVVSDAPSTPGRP
jgi:UDP-N-acetylglucosamine:LPS N-acetylglucosamine transferase